MVNWLEVDGRDYILEDSGGKKNFMYGKLLFLGILERKIILLVIICVIGFNI